MREHHAAGFAITGSVARQLSGMREVAFDASVVLRVGRAKHQWRILLQRMQPVGVVQPVQAERCGVGSERAENGGTARSQARGAGRPRLVRSLGGDQRLARAWRRSR